MYSKILALSALTFVVLVSFIATSIANAEQGFTAQFKSFIETRSSEETPSKIEDAVSQFYQKMNYQPVWLREEDDTLVPKIDELNTIIKAHAQYNGLNEDTYDLNTAKHTAQAEKKTSLPS